MKDPVDTGSEKLHEQRTVVPRLRGPHSYHMKVMDETEIDRMFLRGDINADQYEILGRFAERLHKAGMGSIRSPDYSSPIHADATAVGDKRARAMLGIKSMMQSLREEIGVESLGQLIALVVEDRPFSGDLDNVLDSLRNKC